MTSRPAFIVSSGDLPERTHIYPHSEERMGPLRSMGKAAGRFASASTFSVCRPALARHGRMPKRTKRSSSTSSKVWSTPGSTATCTVWSPGISLRFRPAPGSATASSTTAIVRHCCWSAAKQQNVAAASSIHSTRRGGRTCRRVTGGAMRLSDNLGHMTACPTLYVVELGRTARLRSQSTRGSQSR